MIVYAESNFVLELTWKQESFDDAQFILDSARRGAINLVLPAVSLIEPSWTLEHKNQQRRDLLDGMSRHLRDLRRSQAQGQIASALLSAKDHFESVIPLDALMFEDVTVDVIRASRIIGVDSKTIEYALRNPYARSLRFLDALIWASIRRDLDGDRQDDRTIFVTTNDKDFGTPEIKAELKSVSCDLVHSFRDAANLTRRFGKHV